MGRAAESTVEAHGRGEAGSLLHIPSFPLMPVFTFAPPMLGSVLGAEDLAVTNTRQLLPSWNLWHSWGRWLIRHILPVAGE